MTKPAIHPDIISRYMGMLSDSEARCEPVPGTQVHHIKWMIYELKGMEDREKAMRWLGFIQGVLILYSYTTVAEERDFTRPYFTGIIT